MVIINENLFDEKLQLKCRDRWYYTYNIRGKYEATIDHFGILESLANERADFINSRRILSMNTSNEILTDESLAKQLAQNTAEKVSARIVGEWRRAGLLPPFDAQGGGLGRGKGRGKSGWNEVEQVISQGLRILDLRKVYTLSELYFPLWVEGFPVSNEYVHEALCNPIEWLLEDLEEMAGDLAPKVDRSDRLVEDVIDDAVITLDPLYKILRSIGGTAVPQIAVGAGLNVLLNESYSVDSPEFTEGVHRYDRWKHKVEKVIPVQKSDDSVNESGDLIDFIFKNALFVKQNLSAHSIKEALDNCTDDTLDSVQLDLVSLREVVDVFREYVQILFQDVSEEFKPESLEDALPQLYDLARLIAWIDISMRQKGYGDLIDSLRSYIRYKIKSDFTPEVLDELAKFSPEFAKSIEEVANKIKSATESINSTEISAIGEGL